MEAVEFTTDQLSADIRGADESLGSAKIDPLYPARESLRVLMVAGGTGGHIFPALAVAQELRARWGRRAPAGPEGIIEFLGTGRGLEDRLIPAASFSLHRVTARGLKGISGFERLRNLLVLPRTAVETAFVLREFRPDVVVGMGGYLAGPALLESALQEIPTLIIEPNAVPGFTNRVLGPVVRAAAVGFAQAARYYGPKAFFTGHPVRRAFWEIPARKHTPPFTILILGGSQGSIAINDCVLKSLPLLAADRGRLRVIHQTGERDYQRVQQSYRERGINADVCAFIENMPEAFARADLVVSRAGAATLAELAAAGKASMLIPFPFATDRHQLENAGTLERAGAARLIEQTDLTPERLVREVRELLGRPSLLTEMESNARGLARPHATERIADLIEELARKR